MPTNFLYETKAVNEDGVNGKSFIDQADDGLRVIVSNPLSKAPGTNPEELLGLSLSTCFNATIHAVLKDRKLSNRSRVEVPVQLKKEADEPGYFFEVAVHAAVEDMTQTEAEEIIEVAKKRCPVYKLLKESQTVTVQTVAYT